MDFKKEKIDLGEMLVNDGIITQDILDEVNAGVEESNGETFEEIILKWGYVSDFFLLRAKSMLLNIECCDVVEAEFDNNIVKLLSEKLARKHCCIPLKFDDYNPNKLVIVTDDPLNLDIIDDVQTYTGLQVIPILGLRPRIFEKLDLFYGEEEGRFSSGFAADEKGMTQQSADIQYSYQDSQGSDAIERYDVSEEWAHSGIIKAGDYCFLSYCVGNIGGTIEEQINGAFDQMESRLAMVGLTLENVVQMDCLFRDVWNIPVMEQIIKQRFNGKYPVRKSIQTEFAHVGGKEGLQFQVDAVAYCKK